VIVRPLRYVQLPVFETLSGYTPKAVERKIAAGVWMEGREYRRAPDGHVMVDLVEFERWVEKGLE